MFKLLVSLLLMPLGTAIAAAPSPEKKATHRVRLLVAMQNWRPQLTRSQNGILSAMETKADEKAPERLGVLQGKKPVDLNLGYNFFGKPFLSTEESMTIGLLTTPPAASPSPKKTPSGSDEPIFTPKWEVRTEGRENLVCIYSKEKRRWTNPLAMTMAINPEDIENKIAFFNASGSMIVIKLNASNAYTLKPGECVLGESRKAGGNFPMQAAIGRTSGYEILANTRMSCAPDGLTVILFTHVDPLIDRTGVAIVNTSVNFKEEPESPPPQETKPKVALSR